MAASPLPPLAISLFFLWSFISTASGASVTVARGSLPSPFWPVFDLAPSHAANQTSADVPPNGDINPVSAQAYFQKHGLMLGTSGSTAYQTGLVNWSTRTRSVSTMVNLPVGEGALCVSQARTSSGKNDLSQSPAHHLLVTTDVLTLSRGKKPQQVFVSLLRFAMGSRTSGACPTAALASVLSSPSSKLR
jgi:hypothetical protein